ncbi:unnamed protein product [Closterium sp. Naga37s-1]|nr:unnamed protein product [Closterium sp. Naga37s-1]
MLVVKENRAVSLQDLTAAVACFPHLSHVHLSDNSVETIDDAFLAHLAAACPKLMSLHVGKEITKMWDWEREDEHPVTEAGLDHFVRRCTQLQHLSLYCLHRYGRLPASVSLLTDLHTLALTQSSPLEEMEFTHLSSLATLSVDISDQEELDLTALVHLPAFTSLFLCGDSQLILEGYDARPVSFARMALLESLEFNYSTPRFDLLFPSGVSCRRLERLLLRFCDELERLPDDMGERLPRLRDLSICACRNLTELPDKFTSLTCLQKLTLSALDLASLPENFGKLPALRELTLQQLLISGLPETFSQLTSLEALNLVDCRAMLALPARFGSLHALKSLCIANSPKLVLPEDIELPALPRLRSMSLTGVALVRGLVATVSLTSVEHLELALAGEAEELPLSLALCPNLRTLTIQSAACLKTLPDELGSTVQQLRQLRIEQAPELRELPDSFTQLHCLTSLEVHAPKLASLPHGIGALSQLRQLNLAHCSSLTRLPASVTRLCCLHKLNLGYTPIRSLPCHLAHMSRLKDLDLDSCKHLESLPHDFTQLQMLHNLNVSGCDKLTSERGCLKDAGVRDMYGLYVS